VAERGNYSIINNNNSNNNLVIIARTRKEIMMSLFVIGMSARRGHSLQQLHQASAFSVLGSRYGSFVMVCNMAEEHHEGLKRFFLK